jgi:hypothetical protein
MSSDERRLDNRSGHYKSQYGMTIEQYQEMLNAQGGCCAICGTGEPGRRGNLHFCVDHDHITGKARGLLCNNCNLGLGRFRDSPKFLEQAAGYLRHHIGTNHQPKEEP